MTTSNERSSKLHPMNVYVAPRSAAEKSVRARSGISGAPEPEEIAPGILPTPSHDLRFHGGKIIPQLSFFNFYVGGDQAWQQSDIQNIDGALAKAMSDPHLNNVMAQYFFGKPISSTSLGSGILAGPPPQVVSQGDVEQMVSNLHAAGNLDRFDLETTVFNFLLPSGTVLNTDENTTGANTSDDAAPATVQSAQALDNEAHHKPIVAKDKEDSLNGLGGYHGSVHPDSNGGQVTLYYAVGVFSEVLPDGTQNGIPVFDQPWKNVVATFYHELNEARTDADVEDAIRAGNNPSANKFLGWTSRQGEECGDFPVSEANPLTMVFKEVPLTDGSGTVPIQFQYSDAVHGPEGPIPTPHETRP